MKGKNERKFNVFILENNEQMGEESALLAGEILKQFTAKLDKKCIATFAAAPSQDTFLYNLSKNKDIKWENVYAFHLDEYITLPDGHPNTFKEYLKTHIFDKVDIPSKNIFYIKDSGKNADEMIMNYTKLFSDKYKEVKKEDGIYIAFIGIGVNGHIAFNEPETDLWSNKLMIKVRIDDISVKQQYDDYKNHPNPNARYKTLEDVPREALTMSVGAILKADKILCIVPGKQKANAVKLTIEGEITNKVPASLLRLHKDINLYLDTYSSSLLKDAPELKIDE